MKIKIILIALFFVISSMPCTPAAAKKESGKLRAPEIINVDLNHDAICFSWEYVDGAFKYSLDVDLDVDLDGDSAPDMVVEFSFGTGDRTDGGEPSDPNLCVKLEDFVFDKDGDGDPDRVYGTAHVKVKALNPGKGNGRQNNPFSSVVDSPLTPSDTQFCDPLDPLAWCLFN